MTVEICPVCNGNGLVSNSFYATGGDYPYRVSNSVAPEKCRSCDGRGYVFIDQVEIYKPQNNTGENG